MKTIHIDHTRVLVLNYHQTMILSQSTYGKRLKCEAKISIVPISSKYYRRQHFYHTDSLVLQSWIM